VFWIVSHVKLLTTTAHIIQIHKKSQKTEKAFTKSQCHEIVTTNNSRW